MILTMGNGAHIYYSYHIGKDFMKIIELPQFATCTPKFEELFFKLAQNFLRISIIFDNIIICQTPLRDQDNHLGTSPRYVMRKTPLICQVNDLRLLCRKRRQLQKKLISKRNEQLRLVSKTVENRLKSFFFVLWQSCTTALLPKNITSHQQQLKGAHFVASTFCLFSAYNIYFY